MALMTLMNLYPVRKIIGEGAFALRAVKKFQNLSTFCAVKSAPPIEMFALREAFNKDRHKMKTNLGIEAYRDENGAPWVLPVVRKSEIRIAGDTWINHEYLPILGNPHFTKLATEFLLGPDSPAIKENRAFGVQSLSATGALRLGAEFLAKILCKKYFFYSNPTWENHHLVFSEAGFKFGTSYTYWDDHSRTINFEQFICDLCGVPEGSVIILHACAHNPTGMDPSHQQWMRIAEVMKERNLFPFFDITYQGFASGDPDCDAWAVRYFAKQGLELFAAQSFGKSFGLYSERIGNLAIVTRNSKTVNNIRSQFARIVRANYSNPPAFGSRVVSLILSDQMMKAEFLACVKAMSDRIRSMREQLQENLTKLDTPGTWDHITDQNGLFSYTGLTADQVDTLIKDYHIYLPKSGRINLCGLNDKNVGYVAQAMNSVITGNDKIQAIGKCS